MRWQLRVCFWSLVALLGVAGCRPAPGPTLVAPTAAVSPTIATPSIESTSLVETPAATPTVPLPSPSPTLSPTPPPTLPATATPDATPTPAPPVVHYFQADVTEAAPGDTATLSWSTAGATSVAIYHIFDGRLGEPHWEVGASGSVVYAIPPQERNQATFVLFAETPPLPVVSATLTIRLRCTAVWFISSPPDVCPQEPPLYSPAAEQPFERGAMVWVGALDRIYVFYHDDSPAWSAFVDEFDEEEPTDDPNLTPPTGRYQPVRGFGLVWRTYPDVRARLGWGLAPEAGYVTTWQTTSYTRYNHVYLRSLDGGVYHLYPEGSRWEK